MPMSTNQTSPRRGFMAVENVQYFLFHFMCWQHIGPCFLLALPREKSQVVPELAQHRFGQVLDFRKQHLLSAQVLIMHKNPSRASCKRGSEALATTPCANQRWLAPIRLALCSSFPGIN